MSEATLSQTSQAIVPHELLSIELRPDTEDGRLLWLATMRGHKSVEGLSAFGDTPEVALEELQVAYQGSREVYLEESSYLLPEWPERRSSPVFPTPDDGIDNTSYQMPGGTGRRWPLARPLDLESARAIVLKLESLRLLNWGNTEEPYANPSANHVEVAPPPEPFEVFNADGQMLGILRYLEEYDDWVFFSAAAPIPSKDFPSP